MSEEPSLPAAKGLSWTALTHPGRFRPNNEDAFLALTFDAHNLQRLGKLGEADFTFGDFIFAVSDGMGGHNAGEFASRIAIERIAASFPRFFRMGAMGIDAGATDILGQLFSEIHRQIVHLGQAYEELRGMGATLTLAWFRPGQMYFCHVGDSRIYYLPRDGGIKQITEDHSHVGWLVRTGKITEQQARYHPAKNRLSQAVAANQPTIDPHFGSVRFEPGDRFLLCTDGLTDGLSSNGINHLIRDFPPVMQGKPLAEGLVMESIAGSGRDNTTAVIVEVVG
jgi:serine/threonine protein phosphatase PrpC